MALNPMLLQHYGYFKNDNVLISAIFPVFCVDVQQWGIVYVQHKQTFSPWSLTRQLRAVITVYFGFMFLAELLMWQTFPYKNTFDLVE